jgi:hypothetical protein
MSTPDKPQGKASGKNPGGLFVDPLDKWDDEAPDLPGAPETTGKGSKPTRSAKVREEAKQILIHDVDNAAAKVEKLIQKLAKPGLSRAERAEVNKALAEARRAFLSIQQSSNKLSLELKETRRLEAEAYAKINRLKTWKANAGNAGLTPDQEKQLEQTEDMLRNFIKATNVYRNGDNHKDEDVRKEVFNKLDMLVDKIGDLPEYVQDMFTDEDKKIDLMLKRQQEAKDFVAKQNKAMKNFMWKTADRMGIGAFNLGNLIRGGRAVYNLPKNAKAGYSAVKDKVSETRAYVKKTLEMRRLAKSPIVGDDELEAAGNGRGPGANDQKKASSVLERYSQASERFRRRLLDRFGKKKDNKPKPEEDKSMLEGMRDFFGKGGFLRSLLGVVAKVSAVAIAGAIGYWVGSKVWEKIAPWVGEKFNNLSGLDESGRNATRQVVLNTQQNYDNAKSIETRLSQVGTANSVTPTEKDFLASYYKDNAAQAKDMSTYKPSAAMVKINEQRSTGGFARTDRAASVAAASVASVAAPGVSPASSTVTLPDNGAGAGRGSVNPQVAQPSAITPVSTGGQVSDVIGKTLQVSGNADVKGLNPALQSNLVNMANEYYAATGKKLQVNSGFRSPKDQEKLFKSMPAGMAAKPGSSLHNYGLAVDVQSAQANELHNLGLLEKYGFVRPIQTEKWHMQPAGVTVAAAKAGVYSADSPAHQGGTQVAQAKPDTVSVASAEPRIPVTTSGGTAVGSGSGGSVGTMSSSSKKSAADIPTFDTSDGMLTGMNLGVIAS